MRRLVDNLLDVMRLEAGRIEPRLQPVDLGALSASIASMFDGAYERAGLTLEVVTSPTAHATAVDPELWERIVANLLANALKYTREGGVRVLVDEDGGRSRVRVTDTGLGIPPDDLPRIFERFVRLDQPGARSQEGSGIGLALTAELVRLHGGTIGAESNPGRGTTFTVTLPVAAPTATATATTRPGTPAVRGARRATGSVLEDVEDWLRDDAAPSADDASVDADPARGALRGAHILVVDDNRDMRAYLRRLLGGARVTAVGSAASAMSVLRAQRVDLLVADVMLPGMSGTDLVREVRRDPSLASLPIVMLSARAGEEASLDGLAAGADDYLVKPFTPTELVGRIAARLATARERRRTETALETVHRQLERQVAILDTVVFASPVGIGVWDADLRCLIVNERLAALNELPIEDHLGRTPEEYLPDRWPLYQPYFEAALAGTPTLGVEFEGRHPTTGEWQAVVASYYPLRDDGGPVYGVALACVDVTEGRERERQLQDALSAKDEFLGLVSHELRTPLTTILGAARVLTDRAGSLGEAQRRELLGDLSGEAERLNRIVENLLTLARLSAGHAPELEPVLVGRVVHRVVESRMRDLPDRPIRLQVDRPDAPASAHAGYVEQVIANLVSNADKYSEAGEPIDVHVRHEGDEVLVSVADRGAGIGPDEAERLFDPFYRSPRTAAKAGLGIGLTVCRRLVEAQGGRLWVEPRRDGGSVFSVALPAAAAED
jgi:signal transduction histidine kinase